VESNLSPVMAGINDNNRVIIRVTRRVTLLKFKFLKGFRGYQRSANPGLVRACLLNAQNKDVVNHRKEYCSCVQKKTCEPCKKRQKEGCNWTLCLRNTILRVSLSFLSILFVAYADCSQLHSQISRHKSRRLKTIEMKPHLVLYSTKPYFGVTRSDTFNYKIEGL
jgi:hypothetical protein